MLEGLNLHRLEQLWDRRDRRDQIKELEGQLEELGEWGVEWETERERQRHWYTLADASIPDFATPFITKVARLGLTPPNPTSSKLCDFCKNIPSQPIDNLSWPGRQAACELCQMISKLALRQDDHYRGRLHIFIQPPFLKVQVMAEPAWVRTLRLYADPDSNAACRGHKIGFPVLPEPRSDAYFLLLQEWLADCDRNHGEHADIILEVPKLPTRVLDVRDRTMLHLRCTNGERGRYIALSHCWGKAKTFSTTRENLGEFCKGIKIDQLPKTFQDAVEVTQKLGILFLWIDSLCIIQNDQKDWERESKRMESVFASAYCTIAATSAKDCTEGFLSRQSLKDCVHLPIRDAHDEFYVYASRVDENFTQDVEKGILNQRAWVFQERALSCRIIHFTAAQTYWECGSVIRSECLVDSFRDLNWLGDSNFPQTASRLLPGISDSMFEDIFAQYSGLDITKLEDRPVAIQGLESRLSGFYETKSAYGILECFLHRSLLWQRSENTRMRPIHFKGEQVPSWSWMAFSGKIRYGIKNAWHRRARTKFSGGLELDAKGRHIIAPLAGTLQGFRIEPDAYTNCELRDANDNLVGWVRFDQDDEHDVKTLGYIVIGWSESGWENYAGVSWKMKARALSYYVLLVTPALQKHEGRRVFRRLGVAVIQDQLPSGRERRRRVRVI